jgi:hypothetical protein
MRSRRSRWCGPCSGVARSSRLEEDVRRVKRTWHRRPHLADSFRTSAVLPASPRTPTGSLPAGSNPPDARNTSVS